VSREMRRGEEVTAPCGMVVAGLVGRAGDQGDGSDGSVDEDGTAGGKFGGKGGHAGDSVCPPPLTADNLPLTEDGSWTGRGQKGVGGPPIEISHARIQALCEM
jgi:hypothetical protein